MEKIFKKSELEELFKKGLWDIFGDQIEEQKKLYEGLIKTYPTEITVKKIKKDYKDCIINVDKNNSESIIVLTKNSTEINNIIKTMDLYGWFISKPRKGEAVPVVNVSGQNYFQLRFEAKFDVDSTESIYQQKNQKFLYHITPLVNLEKIKNIGLTPKTNSKLAYHPERVYFLKNIENENFIKNFIGKLFVVNKNNIELKEKYVILKIDLGKELKNEIKPKIRFFADPNMSGAVYTLENISPNSIEPVKLATIEFVDDDMLGFKIELTDF